MIVNNEFGVGTSGCGLRVGALTAVAWRFSESAIDTVFTTCYNSKQIKNSFFPLQKQEAASHCNRDAVCSLRGGL
jgi:hypothetical protein